MNKLIILSAISAIFFGFMYVLSDSTFVGILFIVSMLLSCGTIVIDDLYDTFKKPEQDNQQ